MSFNLYTMLAEATSASPEHPCVVSGATTLSYGEVDERAGRLAGNLLARGLRPGAKVGVQLPNIPEFVISYFGLMRAGMVMVPLNPLLRSAEVVHQLSDAEAAALITSRDCISEARAAARQIPGLQAYVVGDDAQAVPPGWSGFSELQVPVAVPDLAVTSADDTAVLLYTSGTTGKPKGAELSHFQLLMNCTVGGDLVSATPDDVVVGVLPLFHVFGLSSVLNVAVRYRATMVLVPRFDPTVALEAVHRHAATIFAGVPTMYIAMLGAAAPDCDLSTLRVAVSGGASLPGEVIRAFEQRFTAVTILEGYGLSETASTATFNISADQRKVGSIGKPVWGVRVRVVDKAGLPLPAGSKHVGEIVVQGHNVMKGYYRNPEATAAAIKDGWLHTGDLGYVDEDGYLFIVDRLKDVVIRGGYNVYPREIEEVLYTHPAVTEAAVVGTPHETLGEEVLAVVSLAPGSEVTADGLIDFCRQRLAPYKYPRDVRIVDELPKGPTGKILKRELRHG